jgi:hypothetical protein
LQIYIQKVKKTLDLYINLFVYSGMNKTLLNEVREVKRKISLPIVRKGSRGELVPPKFTERENELLLEMLTRRSKRHPTPGGHISAPMKMNKNE